MTFVERFIAFVEKEKLFRRSDRLLLAVSGGLDSTVLCELCKSAGYRFQIAHCNFMLRGEESTRDEHFVRQLSEKYGVILHVKQFNTAEYSIKNQISIQLAARYLRYTWFSQLTGGSWKSPVQEVEVPLEKIADKLVTAHHGDDNLETVLMNFMKGTGIGGLRGILPLQGNIARPLLFARKEELLEFAHAANLTWVEDSSNSSGKYTRNRLRNETIPLLEKVYPSVAENIFNSIPRFRGIESLYRQRIDQLQKKLVVPVGKEFHIPVLRLKQIPEAATFLFEIGKPFGFTAAQSFELQGLLDAETGKFVQSPTHSMIRHRNMLILAARNVEDTDMVVIESPDAQVQFAGGNLQLDIRDRAAEANIMSNDLSSALLDFDRIVFPLVLRKRRQGDYFYPLGMKTKKKVGRFLSDLKLSAPEKEKCWLLEMNKKIIWVVGRRIDDRFKVTENTSRLLQITLLSNEF